MRKQDKIHFAIIYAFIICLFVYGYLKNSVKKQKHEKSIQNIDSAILAIPYKYDDSSRSEYFKNYQQNRNK